MWRDSLANLSTKREESSDSLFPGLAGAAFALWRRESSTDRESKFGRKEERETERVQSSAREREREDEKRIKN